MNLKQSSEDRKTIYRRFGKRFLDFVAAVIGLSIFWPIMLLVAVVLWFAQRGDIFFIQERSGKDGKPIRLYKFKTMKDISASDDVCESEAVRITPLGKFLRRTSLDELPQLLNVLGGSMSLVGPRPLLTEYLPLYNEAQRKRLKVRPGITGLAQVSGRNQLNWEQKFELDARYVDKYSFCFDVLILAKTVEKVLSAQGVSPEGEEVVGKFAGNRVNPSR